MLLPYDAHLCCQARCRSLSRDLNPSSVPVALFLPKLWVRRDSCLRLSVSFHVFPSVGSSIRVDFK